MYRLMRTNRVVLTKPNTWGRMAPSPMRRFEVEQIGLFPDRPEAVAAMERLNDKLPLDSTVSHYVQLIPAAIE